MQRVYSICISDRSLYYPNIVQGERNAKSLLNLHFPSRSRYYPNIAQAERNTKSLLDLKILKRLSIPIHPQQSTFRNKKSEEIKIFSQKPLSLHKELYGHENLPSCHWENSRHIYREHQRLRKTNQSLHPLFYSMSFRGKKHKKHDTRTAKKRRRRHVCQ